VRDQKPHPCLSKQRKGWDGAPPRKYWPAKGWVLIQGLCSGLRGWSAQTCRANSLSRCSSKLRIISSKDAPAGGPEGVNRQPHSEQPKPRKRECSIHFSSRFMAARFASPRHYLTACLLPAVEGRSVLLSQRRTEWLQQKTVAQSGRDQRCMERRGGFYSRQFGRSVGRPTYLDKILGEGTPDFGAGFKAQRGRSEANVRYPTEASGLEPVQSSPKRE
jgi:hypothetical protein